MESPRKVILMQMELETESKSDQIECECAFCILIRGQLKIFITNLFLGVLIPLSWIYNICVITYAFSINRLRSEQHHDKVESDHTKKWELAHLTDIDISHEEMKYKSKRLIAYSICSIVIYSIFAILLLYAISNRPFNEYSHLHQSESIS